MINKKRHINGKNNQAFICRINTVKPDKKPIFIPCLTVALDLKISIIVSVINNNAALSVKIHHEDFRKKLEVKRGRISRQDILIGSFLLE